MAGFISRHKFHWGIASAMTLSMVFVIVLLMGLATFIDIRRERSLARDGLERYGALMANSLDEVLANDLYFSRIDALEDIAEVLASQPQITGVKIFRPDGRLLAEELSSENRSEHVTGQLANGAALDAVQQGKEWRQFGETTLETTLDLAIPVSVDGDLLGGVQLSFTAEARNEEIRSIILSRLWQGLALIALGTALAYLIARYTSRSIGDLAAVAGEIGRGNLDVSVPSRGTKETVELGQTLESMRILLQELYHNLEQRVQERTTELSRAADKLQVEVAEREKAEKEQRRLTEESQLVAGIGRIIGSSLNVAEVYEGFVALVSSLVPWDWIAINKIDRQRGLLTLTYIAGTEMPGRKAGTVVPLAGTLSEAVAQSPQGLLLDVDDRDKFVLEFPSLSPYVDAGVRSFLGVPLVSRGEVIATLNMVPSAATVYTEYHLELARNIGAQIAGAIANADIYAQREKAEQAARQLAAENRLLADVGRIITLSPNIDDVYHRFADRIREHMSFDYMSISLVGVEDGVSISAYVSGSDVPGKRAGDRIPLAGALTGMVARTRTSKLIVTDNRQKLKSAFPRLLADFDAGHRSFLSVPLITGDEVIAILNVRSAQQDVYSERELGLMEQVGRQIAPAIENARLFEQVKSNAEEMAAVDEVARLVTTNLDLDQVYERFADEVKKLVDFDRMSINVIDEDAGVFTFKYSAGLVRPGRQILDVVPLEGSQTQRVLETGQTLVVPDVSINTWFSGTDRFLQEGLRFRSSIVVPLTHQGHVLGTMSLRSLRVGAYTPRDQIILERLASQIAPALENAHLFEQLKVGQERLRNLSQRLVEVQEAERRHVARELHDEIGQVLTGLKLSLELIPHVPEEAVKANLEESTALVNELMGKVRELSLDLRPAMLDDLGLLPTLLWYFERFTARTQVDVGFEHTGLDRRFLPEIETTAFRIVQEALTNVARHAGADRVSVRLWSNDEVLGLSIEDQGAGFNATDESILNKSNGLAGMRERAALLGGQLTLESAPGLGTNLFAELPFGPRNGISVERNGYDNHSLGG